MPEFGTDLIKYIFEMNDDITWGNIKEEIKESVSKYVPGATINDINVIMREDDNSTFVDIDYSVLKGKTSVNNRMVIKL